MLAIYYLVLGTLAAYAPGDLIGAACHAIDLVSSGFCNMINDKTL